MGETTFQDQVEEIMKEITSRALQFLKENEPILIVKLLLGDPRMVKEIAKLFVAINESLYKATINLARNSMYGYSYEETDYYVNWLTSEGAVVDVYLPNGVHLGAVRISYDQERMLQKYVQLKLNKYEEILRKINNYIEEAKKEDN
jgi:hypothetical protein